MQQLPRPAADQFGAPTAILGRAGRALRTTADRSASCSAPAPRAASSTTSATSGAPPCARRRPLAAGTARTLSFGTASAAASARRAHASRAAADAGCTVGSWS